MSLAKLFCRLQFSYFLLIAFSGKMTIKYFSPEMELLRVDKCFIFSHFLYLVTFCVSLKYRKTRICTDRTSKDVCGITAVLIMHYGWQQIWVTTLVVLARVWKKRRKKDTSSVIWMTFVSIFFFYKKMNLNKKSTTTTKTTITHNYNIISNTFRCKRGSNPIPNRCIKRPKKNA